MSDRPDPNAPETEADVGLGHVVELLARGARPGPIVDLVAGAQAGATEALEQRGLRVVPVGLDHLSSLADRLARLGDTAGTIGAFCLLDLLDRLPDPESLLRIVSEYAAAHGSPLLVVSVPNVGHQDVALGLLAGRWLPATGDSPPRRFFTRDTLARLLAEQGWQPVAEHDLERAPADRADAATLLHAPTLAGDAVREVGRLFNPDARVSRFVWALRPAQPERPLTSAPSPASPALTSARPALTPQPPLPQAGEGEQDGPVVSILMRTQGRRNDLLTEALYSAYAQTSDDYEVVLGFHNPDDTSGGLRAGVERLLGQLPKPLQRKVRLIVCEGEGRGAPLNTLLEAASGLYASFLDDDDLFLEHHVETLVRGAREHGANVLLQTFAAQRLIEPVLSVPPSPTLSQGQREQRAPAYPYTTVGMSVPWDRPFEPVAEHHHNLVPICCMAVPTRLIRETGLRFRLDLEVGEDWDFWMSASQVLRVVVLPDVTAVVNHWNDATSNAMRRPDVARLWQQVRDGRHHDRAAVPLLLDGTVRTELQALGRQPEEVALLRAQLAERETRLNNIQRSRAWRVAEMLWWASGRVRQGLKPRRPR
jgi:hypothetical protein